ncbi:Lytic transglycosylase, catalytic [Thermosinus carboxydivorans Nor1]|uniref:Lytic transglycosylase, catalytic n=1 Tax=Thermosinus carboxydivorans Nor1 TaxID=401526 RepID=A1HR61_9FIRM|nr:LPD38 domain-containing protein [Thermosinus carboxydivorans]EAX47558.1 Lytic transglycosylase, catalytic [Thermosinus carboxydivorans Nor1]
MFTLDDFASKYSDENKLDSLDSFAAKHLGPKQPQPSPTIPAPEIPIDVPQEEPAPGFLTNLAKDISRIGARYLEGARQAWDEVQRANQRYDAVASDPNADLTDIEAARYQANAAQGQFVKDVAQTPLMIGALAGAPGAAVAVAPFIAADIANAAQERFQQEGALGAAKQVAGDVTGIGPAIEELPKVFNLDYWKQAYEEPVTTIGSTAMALAPAALIGKGVYKGVSGVVEDKVKSALDEFDFTKSDELPTNPNVEALVKAIAEQESGGDYGAVNPDSGARGKFQIMPENWPEWAEEFGLGRDAPMTPENQEYVATRKIRQLFDKYGNAEDVARAWYAGEGYVDALRRGEPPYSPDVRFNADGIADPNGQYPSVNEYAQQVVSRMGKPGFAPDAVTDYDLAETWVRPATREELQASLLDALRQIGEQKWDEAEQAAAESAFWRDIPYHEKGKLAGEGLVLGEEKPQARIILPGEAEVNPEAIKVIEALKKQAEIDAEIARTKGDPRQFLADAIKAGDYYRAARWAEIVGSKDLAEKYRKLWWKEQGFKDEPAIDLSRVEPTLHDIRPDIKQFIEDTTQRIAADRKNARQELLNALEAVKQKAWDNAEAEAVTSRMNPEAIVLTEYFNTYKISPEALEKALRRRQEKLIDDYMSVLRSQMKQGVENRSMTPVLDKAGNPTGEYTFSPGYSRNYQWYRDMLEANGGKMPKKADLEYWLRETAVDHLRNGYRDPMYGELPPSSEFVKIEQALSGLQKYRKQLPFELRTWEKNKAIDENALESGAEVAGLVNQAPPPPGIEYLRKRSNMAQSGLSVPVNSPRPETSSGVTVPETISRKQIMDKINELFTAVRTGRLGVDGVLGWFDRNSEVIRTKGYADFRAIMHEIGHYLDKGLGLRNDARFDNELISAVHRRFGDAYDNLPVERLRGEGIAEFIHDYTTNKARAQAEFPQYYAAFEKRLKKEPEIRGRLKIVSDMLKTWYNQAAKDRVKGSISFGDRRTAFEKTKDAVKNPKQTAEAIAESGREIIDKVYDKFVDELAPLDRMMKEIEKLTGEKLPLAQDVFKQAWLARGWAGKAQTLIEHGIPEKGIPSLKSIVKSVEKNIDDFSAYLVALREIDMYRMEEQGLGKFEHAISKADAALTVAEGRQRPEFVKAQQELVKFQNHLLDILVDAGIKDRASVEIMKTKWPNYVPFFREFDEAAIEKFLSGKGFGNVSDPIKKLKGSTRDIINPLESIVKNTYLFINLAERNRVARLFVDLAQKPGLGKLIEEVSGPASSKDSTFAVWDKGKKRVFQTTPELYRAIMLLDREAAGVIEKILSIPAGWLRAGAVLSPEFIVRNPVRDAHSAFIYSKYGFIPVIDTFRGLAHVLKKDDLYWEYMNSGAAHSTMVSLDRDYLAKNLREIMSKPGYQKFIAPLNPKTYIDILRAFSETLEMGTRVAEYENARRGYNGVINRLFSNKRTQRSMEEAALAARDITLDFSRAGTVGKKINKVVAFWNATIQGMDKMIRAFKEDPVTTSAKVFMSVTLPSIVLWYLNKDDPRYQELPQWQKDLFWIIPAKDTLIRIPKPFEVGILFGTSVERMLDWMYKKDPNAFKGYGKTVWDAMVPGWMPTALLPIVEWTSNYSYFMERNIVPPSQEKLPPKLQYGPNTSAIGKWIGEHAITPWTPQGVSPAKVDNTIRGYTGGLGGLAMTLGDLVAGEFDKRPSLKWTEYPGIRAFTATPYRSSKSVQDFYDRWNEVQQMYNEYKQTGVKPAGLDGAEYRRLQGVNEIMQKINKREKEILSDKNMSSEEKRSRLDQLNVMKTNYARIALGRQKIAQ